MGKGIRTRKEGGGRTWRMIEEKVNERDLNLRLWCLQKSDEEVVDRRYMEAGRI
jgi:hypothetical protein